MSLAEWKKLGANALIRRRIFGPHNGGDRTVRAVQGWHFDLYRPTPAAAFLFRCPKDTSFEPFCVIQTENGDLKIVDSIDLP